MRKRSGTIAPILTFASTDHKITIDASKATPDDMVSLVLPSKLARESTFVQVPQVYFLSYT